VAGCRGGAPAPWEQAHAGGCSRELWRAPARERAAERPRDAVATYRRLVSASIDLRNDSGYDAARSLTGRPGNGSSGRLPGVERSGASARSWTTIRSSSRGSSRIAEDRRLGRARRWLAEHGLRPGAIPAGHGSAPTDGHADLLGQLLISGRAAANQTTDAHLAALAIEW